MEKTPPNFISHPTKRTILVWTILVLIATTLLLLSLTELFTIPFPFGSPISGLLYGAWLSLIKLIANYYRNTLSN